MAQPERMEFKRRRAALRAGGILATASMVQPLERWLNVLGDPPPGTPLRAEGVGPSRVLTPPPLPQLGVIALNRMGFGPRPGDLAAFSALGATDEQRLTAYVDQQLNPGAIDDSNLDTRLTALGLTTLDKTLEQLWSDHVVNNSDYSYRILPAIETEIATVMRAVYSNRQLVEVLADFWHNHFNVYGWDYSIAPVLVHYDRDIIRGHLLGNFREMLEAMGASTAMLFYLDNYVNQVSGANENFARELFELHTMGAENYYGVRDPINDPLPIDENGLVIGYVDNDVYEAARCFTGWRVDAGYGTGDTGTFLYDDSWHDRFNKFILGGYLPPDQPPLKDGQDVLDMLASHPGTGRFIARKLCRRLIGDNPPPDTVAEAAAVFHANVDSPDQLLQVIRTILLSPAFKSTWGEKIKRPFESAISMMRAVNADFSPSDDYFWTYDRMGQALFSHPAPNGYPDEKEAWTNTMSILHRWRFSNYLIENWIDNVSVNVLIQMPTSKRTANQIVDYWLTRLLGRAIHPVENREEILDFMAQGWNPDYDLPQDLIDDRTPRMVALIFNGARFPMALRRENG